MNVKRIKLEIEINLDPVPGAFHTPESAEGYVQAVLDMQLPHYCPIVTLTEQ